ncbi:MAG TPA: ABC transporter substrate-binding protein [Ilumatobacteraceae bacterium]|nr:ABC transporter substrate-binding protein [Ilumatobacteraceae bacterium]
MRLRLLTALTVTAGLAFTACANDDSADDETASDPATDRESTTDTDAPSAGPTDDSPTDDSPADDGPTDDSLAVVAGEPFPAERCAANEAAGTITYLTGFDFAATASIVDVLVADANGYYDELCLDVEITPSFSTANYPFIAENDAQFASGGSFSEVVAFAAANDAEFVVTAVEGPTAIDSLILKPGVAAGLEDLAGSTIGVKGKLPPSVAAMLATAGLTENEDYETVLIDGFDPVAHIAIESIDGFPGYKSNEPGTLERNGIAFDLFDPLDYDIPGSFGIVYGNAEFLATHPIAAEDFMRATMRGLADAIADPRRAAEIAVEAINAGGNRNFLAPDGEVFRWSTDAALITELTPDGVGFGVPDVDALQDELDAYAAVGLFGEGETPNAADFLVDLLDRIYGADGTVVWPAAGS